MSATPVLIRICIMLGRAQRLATHSWQRESAFHHHELLSARAAPWGSARARDVFLEIFEQVRNRYDFDVIGYIMPEHIHVLIGEPKRDSVPVGL